VLIAADVPAYICRKPVDMRKSIDGLSYLIEPLLAQNPSPLRVIFAMDCCDREAMS
jgi:transposase